MPVLLVSMYALLSMCACVVVVDVCLAVDVLMCACVAVKLPTVLPTVFVLYKFQ